MDYYFQDRRRRGIWTYVIVALIASFIGGAFGAYFVGTDLVQKKLGQNSILPPNNQQIQDNNPNVDLPQSYLGGNTITEAAAKVLPAVVGISTKTIQYDFFYRPVPVEGVGSGVIIDQSGLILTNNHVVGDADEINVLLHDGQQVRGQIIWAEPGLDLAIVKVNATNLSVAATGDSEQLKIGELAIAIGNPLGLEYQRSVTAGIISGLNRSITVEGGLVLEDLIQTDASINPGNSGGPLVNAQGQVIGINTAKASAEGLGFAIPINTAIPIINDLREHGRVLRPWLGIKGIDKEIASYYKLNIRLEKGIFVYEVIAGSPAAKGGLRSNDVIIAFNGQEINTMHELRRILNKLSAGDQVKLTINRGGKIQEVTVTLQEAPQQ
ncbi:MAG TPA: PDZ domain-containing protein [Clostridia bacterium]|nr:PDZ domain-containing protein [Clostridia bacterium]